MNSASPVCQTGLSELKAEPECALTSESERVRSDNSAYPDCRITELSELKAGPECALTAESERARPRIPCLGCGKLLTVRVLKSTIATDCRGSLGNRIRRSFSKGENGGWGARGVSMQNGAAGGCVILVVCVEYRVLCRKGGIQEWLRG